MSAKKILFLVGDFAEDYEVMVPFQALTMVGHIVDAVCPGKKAGEKIKTAIHDFEGDQTYTEKPGHNFTLNATFGDVSAEDYDALMVAGGRAPEYLRLDNRLIAIVRSFAKADKPIAAICHAPWELISAGLVQGRTLTSYHTIQDDIRNAGGNWVDREVVEDDNWVTSRQPDDLFAFNKAMLGLFSKSGVGAHH